MKNKTIMLLIGFITCFPNLNKAQKIIGFVLECKLKKLPNLTKVYLINDVSDTVAKAISQGERFMFQGQLPLDGRFHYIAIDTLVCQTPTNAFFLMNQPMTLIGVLGERDVVMTGSSGQLDYIDIIKTTKPFHERRTELERNINQIGKIIAKEIDSVARIEYQKKREELIQQIRVLDNERIHKVKTWISKHPASFYSPYIINKYGSIYGQIELQNAYNQLIDEVRESQYGIELKKEIEALKLAEFVKLGKTLPNFNISSVSGKPFSVLDYTKKGRITLIDFWASWCGPCRAEIPNMKKVYETFHEKGFNIIGVSTDVKEADWKKALAEDNTKWFHGRDNLEKASKAVFSINSIPAFALVNEEGKLIAFSCAMSNIPSFGPPIRGEELYKTIETLLNEKGK